MFVYFSLGNLHPKFRSGLKHIMLLAIFHHHLVNKYGLNLLLQPILDENKLLEEEVEFVINGKKTTVFETVTILKADNFASHSIGFARGFRKCRYCLGTHEEIQSKFCDRQFIPRTKEEHDADCNTLNTRYG